MSNNNRTIFAVQYIHSEVAENPQRSTEEARFRVATGVRWKDENQYGFGAAVRPRAGAAAAAAGDERVYKHPRRRRAD